MHSMRVLNFVTTIYQKSLFFVIDILAKLTVRRQKTHNLYSCHVLLMHDAVKINQKLKSLRNQWKMKNLGIDWAPQFIKFNY